MTIVIEGARIKWRRTSVLHVYSDSTGYNLWEAGYRTLGDVLDATDAEISTNVRWAGPKRAVQIRRKALAAAKAVSGGESVLSVVTRPGKSPELVAHSPPEPELEPEVEREHALPGITGPLLALAAVGCFGALLILSIS